MGVTVVNILGRLSVPELRVDERRWQAELGDNLLDSLLGASVNVPNSCRAGSCQACMVRCCGAVENLQPQALSPTLRDDGWVLSCQCRVAGDAQIELFDPARQGIKAQVVGLDWLSAKVLRVRLSPLQRLRYRPGQHVLVWLDGIARPYSLASVPTDPWLELHIDCAHHGAFVDRLRQVQISDWLLLGQVSGGALHYDQLWQSQPLRLLAAGTGLAPLAAVLREALAQDHQGPIELWHLASEDTEHYWRSELDELQQQYAQLRVQYLITAQLPAALAQLRLVSRQSAALICGSPKTVETFAKALYLAGLPRKNVFTDVFLTRL